MSFKDIITYFKQSNFLQKLVESFFGRISYMIFSLLFSLICTRIYGVELFGVYTHAFTIVTILMIVARAGLDNGMMYSIPRNKYLHVSFSFVVNFILAVGLTIIGGFIYNDPYIWFVLPLIWLVSSEQLFFALYRTEGKIKEFYFINGFMAILLRVVFVILCYFLIGQNEYSIAIAVYLSFLFSNLIYILHQKGKFQKIHFDMGHLKYSFPLLFATLMATIINKVDILMLGSMATKQDVGVYQITFQISSTISIFLFVFNTVFAPKIADLYHNNKLEELRRIYVNSTRALAALAALYFATIVIFDDFILWVFGEEVVAGKTALLMRNVAQLINVAVGSVWLMLSMTGKPKFQMYANFCAVIMNIALNFVLIPEYGINGAAFASMVAILFTNIAGYIVVSTRFKVKVYKYI
ncbi:MATE family efflux transporter [Thalassobacillus sp. CUG 92003]|uniref:MATE family efflux transporter n=1 Tax=Thalassobacillus sp. CUG 92003 TaxID=2736641 RepID=UPI0015E6AFB3|nr:MATE family efflux transporter [Thalassobacillus sp. CUG 92003]